MKLSTVCPVPCVNALAACLTVFAMSAFGAPPVLRWNDAAGTNVWNTTVTNWLDAGSNAVAWQLGSEARFEGAGGIVNVAADAVVSNITFASSGYTLLGAGRLAVEGAVSAAAGTTNSIVSEIITSVGLSKTGTGALAVARCTGPLTAAEGTLFVSGSLFTDAAITVASGASVVTLGDPDTASNLILNPSFELPALASGAWIYVGTANFISNWTVTALANNVGRQNTASVTGYSNPWNSAGASPEGSHMLILQYNGTVAQTVTVPADGIYSVAFSHLLRATYPENQVYVTLDGVLLASFLNRAVQGSPGRFASGALWLKAGSHTLGIGGEGFWNDRATMVDAVCFAPPSAANACRALTGDSILKVVTGATVRLDHSGTVPLAYVSTNGASASGTFNSSHVSGIFTGGGAFSCATPANVCTWNGSGLWSDAARWTDGTAPAAGGNQNLLLRFPNGLGSASTNDFSGTFLARRLNVSGAATVGAFTLAGNPVALTNDASGVAPKISVQAPGAWIVQSPILARSALTLDVFGTLTLSGNPLTLANGSTFYKSGAGALIMPTLTNTAANAFVYEGLVQTPSLPSSLAVSLLSQSGKDAALYLTQAGTTLGNTLNLQGSGTCTLGTRCGGGSAVTLSNWTIGYGNLSLFDVGAGDTLSLRQMLLAWTSKNGADYSTTALVKTGPGTLEIRSAGSDSDRLRAYQGATTLRNGTLTLSEDDYGTLNGWTNPFNSRTYDGKGGSLGSSSFATTVCIGDSGTTPSDNLALIANGDRRWIGHNIEVFNKGNTVTLGMTTGTVMFANTLTLHRDITLSGPANGIMVFSNIVAAADFSGTGSPTVSGLAALRFEGTVPSGLSLALGARLLRFGTYAVRATTLNALSLGSASPAATLEVDFAPGTNDTIAVTASGGLVLTNTVVNLYCAGTGLPFAEPGTYTLFTYAGTLSGDVPLLLSAGNPQPGASYTFSNDTANARVLLTIGNTSGGTSVIWKNPASGAWSLGSNWDSGSAPGGTGVVPLFGLAITSPSTVALGTAYTVGGLTFNNASYGYTLSGGSLTFDNSGPTPAITVNAGSHTLDTALNGSSGLSVSTASNATLILGSNVVATTGISLASGTVELRGNAAVNGATALAASSLLRVAATNASVGTLSGAASSTLGFNGTSPKLTVNQASDGTFAGLLSGPSGAWLGKAGAGTLALNGPNNAFSGTVAAVQGTLSLQGVALPGALSVTAPATVSVMPAATNGLMGFYYSVTPNTNNFWTLAGMEAHLATLKPDLAAASALAGANFDFTTAGTLFPLPYGSGGSRTVNFEAVYRGTITVPESGTYVFGAQGDDGFILAIDGQTVLGRNYYASGWLDGTIRLDAGRYDIVLGYFQLTSGYGLQLRVKAPSATAASLVPNAWLAPYSSSASLSGSGALACSASNALFRLTQAGSTSFSGNLTGSAGSLLAKDGNGAFSIDGAGATDNAFAGNIDVQKGVLRLGGKDRIGDASAVRVRSGAVLTFVDQETIGTLSGGGSLLLGGYVYQTSFTGDSDSDLSTSKTYTHLLDFPANGSAATINGVAFTDAGFSGSANGYAWATTGTVPPSGWTNSTYIGTTQLLDDFGYGSTNFTITLSGLATNTAYETRLYFRNFANNPRFMTLTFTTGAKTIGSYYFNPDSAGLVRCWIGCRYATDSAGTLSIRVLSTDFSNSPHVYGLSNERASGSAGTEQLILAPTTNRTGRFTGSVTGTGRLAKDGAGTQRFGGANALTVPLDVRAGTAVLDPGASLPAGATVAAGATLKAPLGSVTVGALTGSGTFNLTGAADYSTVTNGPRFVKITGDADCGVSPDKTYTHLIDFGGSATLATVNGVTFNKETAVTGPSFGCSWVNAPAASSHQGGNLTNIGVPSNQGIFNLINDFCYGGSYGPAVMTLTGLTTGKTYEVRFYHRKWEADKARNTTFTFDPDGSGPISSSISFNPDSPAGAANYNDNYLAYRYLAQTNQLAVTITCPNTDKYHIYGLSNEEVPGSLDGSTVLNITNDCVFGGAITGGGPFTKTNAGSFTLTGTSTATGAVTVAAGAYGVANGGTATVGPVTVAPGATLFGDGRMGGNVTVSSNAWLMAGTVSACGTLQVGGSLTLAQGALLAYRYGLANSNDTVTVNGLLTFPASGVVQAEPLPAGASAPGKDVFFVSTQAISGPATLTGWTVQGANKASLKYSDDRKTIYFASPRGMLIVIH